MAEAQDVRAQGVTQGRRIAHHQDQPQVRCSAEYMDTICRCYFPRNGRVRLDISK